MLHYWQRRGCMEINCFYDENMEYTDIVYIPDMIRNIEELQEEFFTWLFDKNNDHPYWIIDNGKKVACKYGTPAFLEWLNNTILSGKGDKSYMIKQDAKEWNSDNICLIF